MRLTSCIFQTHPSEVFRDQDGCGVLLGGCSERGQKAQGVRTSRWGETGLGGRATPQTREGGLWLTSTALGQGQGQIGRAHV